MNRNNEFSATPTQTPNNSVAGFNVYHFHHLVKDTQSVISCCNKIFKQISFKQEKILLLIFLKSNQSTWIFYSIKKGNNDIKLYVLYKQKLTWKRIKIIQESAKKFTLNQNSN